MPTMNTGRSSSSPAIFAVLENFLGEGGPDRVEEAVGLALLILQLGALHLPALDVMLERPLVLAAIVERLGVSEMERQEHLGVVVLGRLEDGIHALEQLLADPFGEIDEVVEVGIGAVHRIVLLERLEDVLARFVEPADGFQRDAIEVQRFGIVGLALERLFEDLQRLVIAVGLVEELAEDCQRLGVFGLFLQRQRIACSAAGCAFRRIWTRAVMISVWTFFGANFSASPRMRSASVSFFCAKSRFAMLLCASM